MIRLEYPSQIPALSDPRSFYGAGFAACIENQMCKISSQGRRVGNAMLPSLNHIKITAKL